MIERTKSAGLPIRWVVADTVYGHSPDLRAFLEEQGYAYALAVPSIEVVCVQTRTGLLLSDVASLAKQALRARDWQRLSQSLGTKGERLFDWARLPVVHGGTVDGCQWLVFRRCLDDPDEVAYFLISAPCDTPLSSMVQASGSRWHSEEDLQATKALGLDQYEVRSYLGWYRHSTLVLLASAFLVSLCRPASRPLPTPAEDPTARPSPPLIALTPCEVRHLLAHLFFPPPTSVPLSCQWSIGSRAPTTTGLAITIVADAPKPAKSRCRVTWPSQNFSRESSAEFSWEISRTQLLGHLPGICQVSSRSCRTSQRTKGVVP